MAEPVVGIPLADGPIARSGCCAVRVVRNLADGTPDDDNAKGAFMLCDGIQRFVFDFDTQAGKVQYDEDACGNPVVNRKRDDQVLRVSWTLTVLKSDWRFEEIIGAKKLLLDGGDIVGAAVDAVSGCKKSTRSTFSMEVWSERVDCSDLADPPYHIDLMGKCKVVPKGFTMEDATAGVVYQGIGEVNKNFGTGPFGDYTSLESEADWCWAEFDTDAIPDCPDPADYIATPVAS